MKEKGDSMIIRDVEFKGSAVDERQYPTDNLPEILLSGRSNVGKSSFINSLLNRKNIAHTSGRPGKTQTLNFYLINNEFYFVDVPGYGYARVSKTEREKFGAIIENYFVNRMNLRLVILLIDFRHEPSADDITMYHYLKSYEIPCLVVATKSDKIPKNQHGKHLKVIKNALGIVDGDLFVPYSSITKQNIEIIYDIIEQVK